MGIISTERIRIHRIAISLHPLKKQIINDGLVIETGFQSFSKKSERKEQNEASLNNPNNGT